MTFKQARLLMERALDRQCSLYAPTYPGVVVDHRLFCTRQFFQIPLVVIVNGWRFLRLTLWDHDENTGVYE